MKNKKVKYCIIVLLVIVIVFAISKFIFAQMIDEKTTYNSSEDLQDNELYIGDYVGYKKGGNDGEIYVNSGYLPLTTTEGLFCIQGGYPLRNYYQISAIKQLNDTNDTNENESKLSYILSRTKGNNVTQNVYNEDQDADSNDIKYSIAQWAVWKNWNELTTNFEDTWEASNTKGFKFPTDNTDSDAIKKISDDATIYSNIINGINNLKISDIAEKTFKIKNGDTYCYNDVLTFIKENGKIYINGTENTNCTVSGEDNTINSTEDITSVKVEIPKYTVTMYLLKSEKTDIQKMIYTKYSTKYIELESKEEKKYNLTIQKVDEKGNNLSGATFSILSSKSITIGKESNTNFSNISAGNFNITNIPGNTAISIYESGIPKGCKELIWKERVTSFYVDTDGGIHMPKTKKEVATYVSTFDQYIYKENSVYKVLFKDYDGIYYGQIGSEDLKDVQEIINNNAKVVNDKEIIQIQITNTKIENKITLQKVDENNISLKGATFSLYASNDIKIGEKLAKEFSNVINKPVSITAPTNGTIIKIVETEAPNGYEKLLEPIYIKIADGKATFVTPGAYNNSNATYAKYFFNKDKITYNGQQIAIVNNDNNDILLKITNLKKEGKYNLGLFKKDDSGNSLSGVPFKIRIENSTNGVIKEQTENTDISGSIKLDNIPISSKDEVQTITITESVEGDYLELNNKRYEKLKSPIVLKMTAKEGENELQIDSLEDNSENKDNHSFSAENNNIQLNVTNSRKTVKLSGKVWLDGEIGKASELNGTYGDSTDKLMNGITVIATNTLNENDKYETTTANDGKYEFEVPEGKYKITFKYNGMDYTEVKNVVSDSTQSKANEIERAEFNNKFKTIMSSEEFNSIYNASSNSQSISNIATPQAYYNSEKNNKGIYVSRLRTTELNADGTPMGETDNTTNPIEVKPTLENYLITAESLEIDCTEGNKEDLDLGLVQRTRADLAVNAGMQEVTLTVNGKAGTYSCSASKNDFTAGIEQLDVMYADYGTLKNDTTDDDLTLEVKYLVQVENQNTVVKSRANKLKVTYDDKLKYQSSELPTGYSYDQDKGIITRDSNKGYMGDLDNMYLIFNMDVSNAQEDLSKAILELDILTAEIISYSTEEGLIDADSIPGNYPNIREDDTGISKKLEVYTSESYKRKITGNVWEDLKVENTSNGNGKLDEGENKIDNVIVQLIDENGEVVKNLQGDNVEISTKKVVDENNETIDNGYYELTDFLPGDYKIRFIYGNTTETAKYNGQDYKSTIDAKKDGYYYNKTETINLFDLTEDNMSFALDDEQRRLKVIDYSTTINKEKGEELNNLAKGSVTAETLENTYMYAETPKIECPVNKDEEYSVEAYTLGTDTVNRIILNKVSEYVKQNVNFGLVERPKADLELKKTISKVAIKVPNSNEIFEFNAPIARTVLDELLIHGSEVNLTYKYTITNNSEVDYYKEGGLSEFYYTGNIGEKDKIVTYTATIYDYMDDIEKTEYLYNGGLIYKPTEESNITVEEGNTIQNIEIFGLGARNIAYKTIKIPEITTQEAEITLSTIMSSATTNWNLGDFSSYIAEISTFKNQVGRKDEDSIPGNGAIIGNINEDDESAANYIVGIPEGENQNYTPYYILGATVVLILAGGIILIKKYAIKK